MINLTTLPYPMFTTTPEEKEILRKCELYYVEKCCDSLWRGGLCSVIVLSSTDDTNIDKRKLLDKINNSLGDYSYLHNYLGSIIGHNFTFSSYEVKNTLRRIWITKLLAYEGE